MNGLYSRFFGVIHSSHSYIAMIFSVSQDVFNSNPVDFSYIVISAVEMHDHLSNLEFLFSI